MNPQTQTLLGLAVFVVPDYPKMTLSAELVPGVVQWPPGFKAEIDAWMLSFFGTTNLVGDGQVMQTQHGVHMNPRTYRELMSRMDDHQFKAQ